MEIYSILVKLPSNLSHNKAVKIKNKIKLRRILILILVIEILKLIMKPLTLIKLRSKVSPTI